MCNKLNIFKLFNLGNLDIRITRECFITVMIVSLCITQIYLLPSSQPLIHFPSQESLRFLEFHMIEVIKCLFFLLGTFMQHIYLRFINDDFVSSLCFSYC